MAVSRSLVMLVALGLLTLGCRGGSASEGEAGSASSSEEQGSESQASSETSVSEDLPDEPMPDWAPEPVTECECEPGETCVILFDDAGCHVGCRDLPDSCGDAPSCDPACNWDLCGHVQCPGEQMIDQFCDLAPTNVTGWVCYGSMVCNPWTDDCPDDEGCHPFGDETIWWWWGTRCYWPGDAPAAVGEPCMRENGPYSGRDNCENHAICWDVDAGTGLGTCVSLCTGAPHDPVCPPGTDCVLVDPMDAAFCLPACDPFADDCAPGYSCNKVNDTLACMPSLWLPAGLDEPCEHANDCAATLACIDQVCAALCDVNAPVCPPQAPSCVPAQTNVAHVGVCQP